MKNTKHIKEESYSNFDFNLNKTNYENNKKKEENKRKPQKTKK